MTSSLVNGDSVSQKTPGISTELLPSKAEFGILWGMSPAVWERDATVEIVYV